ncbi:MAG: dienelactone hydrolase family protein [Syntrophobacteraceae bacterium]|jgi:predicted peptidase
MQKAIHSNTTYDHLIYLPNEYSIREKWPVIFYLHGVGGQGDYLEVLKAHGLPKLLEQRDDLPFVVISPQCPPDEQWSPALLGVLLDHVAAQYSIDDNRIYLTGIGSGGAAVWQWAAKEPERFAAIAPVCGHGNPHEVCKLRDVPVWTFHGARDRIVPISETQSMVLALKLCGGDVAFTIYPEAEHDSWTEAYSNPQLYSWFLEHNRTSFCEPALDPVLEDLD